VQASVKKENGQVVMVPLFLGQDSVAGEVKFFFRNYSCHHGGFFCQKFFSICHFGNQIEFPDFQPHTFATWTFESAVWGILSSNLLSG
jgi:hypothetical protein